VIYYFSVHILSFNILSVSSEEHFTSEHHQTHSSQQLVDQYPSMMTAHQQLPTFIPPISQLYPTPHQPEQQQQQLQQLQLGMF